MNPPLWPLPQIKTAYPNQWVELFDVEIIDSEVVRGRVLAASADKQGLAQPLQAFLKERETQNEPTVMKCIFTGVLPKAPRRWQPSIVLEETRRRL